MVDFSFTSFQENLFQQQQFFDDELRKTMFLFG